jgi:pantetheine-phosphate adenylyltransferase
VHVSTVIYPGSFDPLHNGHLDVVEQAGELFGRVIVATMYNPSKPGGFFDLAEREQLIKESVAHLADVEVRAYAGLAIDAALDAGADFIVKALRSAADFDVEQQMAHMNRAVSGVRTVFVPCRPDLSFLSSRFIREIAQYGGEVGHLVPAPVARRLQAGESRLDDSRPAE